jgi:hypothetical protein
MATAEITVIAMMGVGAPVYSPPIASQTLATTTTPASTTVAVRDGEIVRILARGAAMYITVRNGGTTSDTDPRYCIPDGAVIDIGPLKHGDVLSIRDVA